MKRPLKPLSQRKLKDYNEGLAKRGVVYLSRVPPFMKPAKVKHLMEQHGVVTRVRDRRQSVLCTTFFVSPFFTSAFSLCMRNGYGTTHHRSTKRSTKRSLRVQLLPVHATDRR